MVGSVSNIKMLSMVNLELWGLIKKPKKKKKRNPQYLTM